MIIGGSLCKNPPNFPLGVSLVFQNRLSCSSVSNNTLGEFTKGLIVTMEY